MKRLLHEGGHSVRLLHRPWVFKIIVGSILSLTASSSACAGDDDESEMKDADFARGRIATLIDQLSSPEVRTQADAAAALCLLGAEAKTAIPKLIDLLASEAFYESPHFPTPYRTEIPTPYRTEICDIARSALIAIGPESIVPLVREFPNQTEVVQGRAISVAFWNGPRSRAFLPQILKRYKAASEEDRGSLLNTLVAIDPTGETALPVAIQALRKDKDEGVRRSAAVCLSLSEASGKSGWFRHSPRDASAAAEALLMALKDPSPEVRARAALSLSTYPETAGQSVPALVQLLADEDQYFVAVSNHFGGHEPVAGAAATALARLHKHADQSLPALIKATQGRGRLETAIAELAPHSNRPLEHLTILLEGEQPELALLALARLGNVSRLAIPKLESLTSNADDWIAAQAKMTLACIDPKGHPDAVEFVGKEIAGDSQDSTCAFLTSIGPRAAFAVQFLQMHMLDSKTEGELNWNVVRALEAIGPASATAAPKVIECLDTGYSFYRDNKERALVHFGPAVVPNLIGAMKATTKSPQFHISCLKVLGQLNAGAMEAVPTVMLHVDSEYPHVRLAAAFALGAIASRPNESLPALKRMLSDPRPFVRAAAAESCGAFGQPAQIVVAPLIERLDDDYLDVQVAAAMALGRLGPVAREAIPALRQFAAVENLLLRDTARRALVAIHEKPDVIP